jgi:hypothetical protein
MCYVKLKLKLPGYIEDDGTVSQVTALFYDNASGVLLLQVQALYQYAPTA